MVLKQAIKILERKRKTYAKQVGNGRADILQAVRGTCCQICTTIRSFGWLHFDRSFDGKETLLTIRHFTKLSGAIVKVRLAICTITGRYMLLLLLADDIAFSSLAREFQS